MPRQQYKYHFIYKVTCLLNGKFYIGMHSTSNLEDGYMGSGKRIRYSLNKHGIANHKIEHLEFFENRTELKQRETELVNESLLQDPLCMNLKVGGEGGWGHIINNPDESRNRLTKGREKLAWLHKNDDNFKQQFKEKLLNSWKGQFKLGRFVCSFLGKQHTKETRTQMSKSHQGKHSANKNSQFGTCWIHSLIEKKNKKINKEDLESYLVQGWVKGRKMKFLMEGDT